MGLTSKKSIVINLPGTHLWYWALEAGLRSPLVLKDGLSPWSGEESAKDFYIVLMDTRNEQIVEADQWNLVDWSQGVGLHVNKPINCNVSGLSALVGMGTRDRSGALPADMVGEEGNDAVDLSPATLEDMDHDVTVEDARQSMAAGDDEDEAVDYTLATFDYMDRWFPDELNEATQHSTIAEAGSDDESESNESDASEPEHWADLFTGVRWICGGPYHDGALSPLNVKLILKPSFVAMAVRFLESERSQNVIYIVAK